MNSLLATLFLNKLELICLHTVKWFPVLLFIIYAHLNAFKCCPRGVMVKALDCGIVVGGLELQLRYYVQFWTYTRIIK